MYVETARCDLASRACLFPSLHSAASISFPPPPDSPLPSHPLTFRNVLKVPALFSPQTIINVFLNSKTKKIVPSAAGGGSYFLEVSGLNPESAETRGTRISEFADYLSQP